MQSPKLILGFQGAETGGSQPPASRTFAPLCLPIPTLHGISPAILPLVRICHTKHFSKPKQKNIVKCLLKNKCHTSPITSNNSHVSTIPFFSVLRVAVMESSTAVKLRSCKETNVNIWLKSYHFRASC